ncbi:hypothetical protein JOF56_010100 [Kibdelosporangium banguiense]|uniref:Uncharacterized protein n=1 Tax=Kibdelosporangium banguiense TaxID=1365924 RepID=A0ABS4TZ92_9PSEU|nr:hypothetical protein [Kibdelosporangium banguiense]MBP2329715.1 hypothetical protein [Kibdelosporangium banguiense]
MLNAFDMFQAFFLMNGTRCARRIHLEQELKRDLSEFSFSTEGLQKGLESLTVEGKEMAVDEEVRRYYALRELRTVVDIVRRGGDHVSEILNFEPIQDRLNRIRDQVAEFYTTLGVDVAEVPVRVVESLPEPYATKGFSALTADLGDKKRHGIEPGIYFLRAATSPFLAEYFVAHEIIHVWLGTMSPDESCTLFEEGFAELLSIFGYIAQKYTTDVAAGFYRIFRLNSNAHTRFESYVDGLKQVVFAVDDLGGVPELIDRARVGRPSLNASLNGEGSSARERSPMPVEPGARQGMDDAARSLLLFFPRSLVVSAPAFRVAQVAQDGMTIRELSNQASMTVELTAKALDELDARALTTLRKDGQVVSRNLAREHLERGHLRFDFRAVGSTG